MRCVPPVGRAKHWPISTTKPSMNSEPRLVRRHARVDARARRRHFAIDRFIDDRYNVYICLNSEHVSTHGTFMFYNIVHSFLYNGQSDNRQPYISCLFLFLSGATTGEVG